MIDIRIYRCDKESRDCLISVHCNCRTWIASICNIAGPVIENPIPVKRYGIQIDNLASNIKMGPS